MFSSMGGQTVRGGGRGEIEPDVVVHAYVLIDASGSMSKPYKGQGQTKLEAALDAVFEELVDLSEDGRGDRVLKGTDCISVTLFDDRTLPTSVAEVMPCSKVDLRRLKQEAMELFEGMKGATALYRSVKEVVSVLRQDAEELEWDIEGDLVVNKRGQVVFHKLVVFTDGVDNKSWDELDSMLEACQELEIPNFHMTMVVVGEMHLADMLEGKFKEQEAKGCVVKDAGSISAAFCKANARMRQAKEEAVCELIYMRITSNGHCAPNLGVRGKTDVAVHACVLIDASGSMSQPYQGQGQTKLEAVLDAVFKELFDKGKDDREVVDNGTEGEEDKVLKGTDCISVTLFDDKPLRILPTSKAKVMPCVRVTQGGLKREVMERFERDMGFGTALYRSVKEVVSVMQEDAMGLEQKDGNLVNKRGQVVFHNLVVFTGGVDDMSGEGELERMLEACKKPGVPHFHMTMVVVGGKEEMRLADTLEDRFKAHDCTRSCKVVKDTDDISAAFGKANASMRQAKAQARIRS